MRLTGISVAFVVLHPQDVVPTEPRDDLLDLVDVNQVRPVHAPEDVRVEPRLQLVERPVVATCRRAGSLTTVIAVVGERGVR